MKKKLPFDFGDVIVVKGSEIPVMKVTMMKMNSDGSFSYYGTEILENGDGLEYGPFTESDIEIKKEKK